MINLKTLFLLLPVLLLPAHCATGQVIQANQAVAITIQGVPENDRATINGSYPVGQNGNINMPYIGAVRAAGMLPEQLAANLQSQYRNAGIYTSPTFQVVGDDRGKEIARQIVTVGGDVRSPGPIPFNNGLTLWQAIQAAGGENEFGSIKRVRLFRDGKAMQYDLRKVENMQTELRPGDTIQILRKRPFE